MIDINNVSINSDYSIGVDVSTTPGYHITKVLLWTSNTYKDYNQAIDLSYLLSGLTHQENFFITAPQINSELTELNGIYFIEFTSDEDESTSTCITDANKNIAVVANTTIYQNCLLDKVLKLDIQGCTEEDNECEDCKSNAKDVRFISTILKTLDIAIRFGYIQETLKLFKSLDKLCDICHSCPDLGNTKLVAGYHYGTVNNSIILL